MRAKELGQRGIEFDLDAPGVWIELGQGFLKDVRQANQFAVNVWLANRCRRATLLQRITNNPGRPHAQTRRDTPP